MPIFYRKALEAAAYPDRLDWLCDEHIADWPGLAMALDRLTPEQRCDAIYIDWLLRLNDGRTLILPIRNYLIRQGALAANYLAELAQNADDASDKQSAQINIVRDDDWLFVSNNGRKVTSLNLLGLSRFFVHAAGKVIELNEQTIGRFGIGFKSCYRIASDVIVFTWDQKGHYGFRLPVCRENEPASFPDQNRLAALLTRLSQVGGVTLDQEVQSLQCLGYCTPEFLSDLPPDFETKTANLRSSKRGTLFAFRIRADRRNEVANRISGQANQVYELCPLFLPNLEQVTLAGTSMGLSVSRHDAANDLPGSVRAEKVTLTTSVPDQPQSHSRFWRLHGIAPGDLWQLALHADSQHSLRIEKEADERGVTLKDGSAYAFFPLNGMNQAWSFRFHLHIALPTKLERDNWNPEDSAAVEEQMRRAIRAMGDWLNTRFDTLVRADWSFEHLIEQQPNSPRNVEDWPALWANIVFDELRLAVQQKPLLRTITGKRVSIAEVQCVSVIKKQAAAEAWSILADSENVLGSFPSFVSDGAKIFGIKTAIPDEVGVAFKSILENATVASPIRQAALLAYLSTERHSGGSLERALRNTVVELDGGTQALLGDLMSEPCGTELTQDWHDCFKRIVEWAREAPWQAAHVFDSRADEQFGKLAQPVFNPTWSQLSERLATEQAWHERGDDFWKTSRRPCPADLRKLALAVIRVPAGQQWLQVKNLWIDDDSPVVCFGGLLSEWPLKQSDNRRKQLTKLLKDWGIADEWESSVQEMLAEELPGTFTKALIENLEGDALCVVFSPAFEESHRRLSSAWKQVVTEAEKTAVSRFIQARTREERLNGKTLMSTTIPKSVRAALALSEKFESAPNWLSDAAYQRILRLGLLENLSFKFLSQEDVTSRDEELTQTVLDLFHKWQQKEITADILEGLQTLSASVGVQRRRDIFIGLSIQKRRRLREFFASPSSLPSTASDPEKLMAARLDKAVKHAEPLPDPLSRVSAIAEVTVHIGKLRCEREAINEVLLQREQVATVIAADPLVASVVEKQPGLYGASNGLRIKWFFGEDLVAELPDADVGWFGDRLVFGQFSRPASEEQYVDLLALYRRSDVISNEFRAAQGRGASPFDLYKEFRSHIVEVLIRKHVKEVGYTREHILRELLQNAESAYASKTERVTIPWFEFKIESASRSGDRLIRVRHAGRPFNERDRDGNDRPDIERIVKINAPNQNTSQELGRFNRGFKSVFTVAGDGKISVRSGAYRFEILDLLLLSPPTPKPDHPPTPETEFEFVASREDALAMVGFKNVPTGRAVPDIINPSSLVFLSFLRKVKVIWEDKSWEWTILSEVLSKGWLKIDVAESTTTTAEKFWLHSGKLNDGRSYAVAIKLDRGGRPTVLDQERRKLRLTFETECPFGFDVIISGDFEVDQGRRNLRDLDSSGAQIIYGALDAALARARLLLDEQFSKELWLSWAKVLHLKDAPTVLAATFDRVPQTLAQWTNALEEQMTETLPTNSGSSDLDAAVIPTRLMRRLVKDFGSPWGISSKDWIELDVEEELPARIRDQRTKFSLGKWISSFPNMDPVLVSVRTEFSRPAFDAVKRTFNKAERDEFDTAEKILTDKFKVIYVYDPARPVVDLPVVTERWTSTKLWNWWDQKGRPMDAYTLEGQDNYKLFYGSSEGNAEQRAARLKQDLLCSQTLEGKQIWYRLFGLACLMSSGRRMSEIRDFWAVQLDTSDFWNKTGESNFGEESDALFDELLHRPFINLTASGEHAYFWRRVFYDIRKIHKLVYENDFPDTLLNLVKSGRGVELLDFLKTGKLAGQQNWTGVFGQSAGAPLLFVVRELCRLGVIVDPDVTPHAFFVCTPVRRAMERIGWLPLNSPDPSTFEHLTALSQKLHREIVPEANLLPFYDIPLLDLGLEG
jgi:hypothetical protein